MCCPKKKFWTKQITITPPFKLNGRSLRYVLINIYRCWVLWAHSNEVTISFCKLDWKHFENYQEKHQRILINNNKIDYVYTCNCRTINQICHKVTSLCHSSRDYSGCCCCEDILKKPKCKSVSCYTRQSKSMVTDECIAITITKGIAKQPVRHTRNN